MRGGDDDAFSRQLEAHPELRVVIEHERAMRKQEHALREQEHARFTARIAELEKERDRLRASHERLRQELELFKRRLFIAKAERIDTHQLELEYMQKLRELDQLAGTLGLGKEDEKEADERPAKDGKPKGKRKGNGRTGRRDLRSLALEEERIEIADPHLETLVAAGKVVRHGFEETCKIGHKRGGKRRVVVARIRYKAVDADGNADIITTAMPEHMFPGALATPSLVANVLMENIGKGMPLFRIEDSCARDGVAIDRGTLSRWKKAAGDRLRETIVKAMLEHALSRERPKICVS